MRTPDPVLTAHLYPKLLDELIMLLSDKSEEAWRTITPCSGWTVHDVALHLLDGDVGMLSRGRDGFHASLIKVDGWSELVRLLNDKNESWVRAARGMSPPVVVDLLRHLGDQVAEYLASLDMFQLGSRVSWAGRGPAAKWLDIARGYTERWLHQQHIREAVGARLLLEPKFYRPVLTTFAYSLPRAYEGVPASNGILIRFTVTGDSGGDWYILKESDDWQLQVSHETPVDSIAAITVRPEDAWKAFTKGIEKKELLCRVQVEGNEEMALKSLDAIAILA